MTVQNFRHFLIRESNKISKIYRYPRYNHVTVVRLIELSSVSIDYVKVYHFMAFIHDGT